MKNILPAKTMLLTALGMLALATGSLTASVPRVHAATPPITVWTEDPWIDTAGGTKKPTTADVTGSEWGMTMLGNETEQLMIGLMNTGSAAENVTVTLTPPSTFSTGQANLLVLGAIESRKQTGVSPNNAALVNLFTPAQVRSFNGTFPPSFVGEEVWKDFPVLHLRPNEPVRVWVRVRTYSGTVPGAGATPKGVYPFTLTIAGAQGTITKTVNVEVLPLYMPKEAPVDVLTYGGIDEVLDQQNYTTVRGTNANHDNKKKYVYLNVFSYSRSRLWSNHLADLLALSKSDPDAFRTAVRGAIDAYYKRLIEEDGWKEDQILISIYDEPKEEDLEAFVAVAKEVRAYKPNAKIAGNTGTDSQVMYDTLAPYIDIWIPHETAYRQQRVVDFLNAQKKAKPDTKLWFYSNFYGESSRSEAGLLQWFRRGGWTAVKHNLDGMGYWAVDFAWDDPWNDFDGGLANRNDAILAFRSSAGPILTRGLEGWRESVEDVMLYRMIEKAVAQKRIPSTMVDKAQAWLADTPTRALATFKTDPAYVIGARKEAWNIIRSYADAGTDEGVCTLLYQPGQAVPTGYGAAYAIYDSTKALLLAASCPNLVTAKVTVGATRDTMYTYKTGYYWDNNAWKAYQLFGTTASGTWLSGFGSGTIPLVRGQTRYFVGYTCERVSGTWKCGCKDAACTSPAWQLQGVK